jgi:hypothetical protein
VNIKTVEEIIREQTSYKPASLYNAIFKAIKNGPLAGKAVPLNRNDANAKFRVAKATSRDGKSATKIVTNFVIIDTAGFDVWFDSAKKGIRTTKTINRAQMTMPSLADIKSGQYTPEQLTAFAQHVASKRYGAHRATKRTAPRGVSNNTSGKRGRPNKTAKPA